MPLATRNFEDAITFNRASSATYWDANGVLQTAAIDEPRFDHDPLTGERRAMLTEAEPRTNSAKYSEDWSQWDSAGGAVAVGSYDTTRGVDIWQWDTVGGGSFPRISRFNDKINLASGESCSISLFWLQGGLAPNIRLGVYDGTNHTVQVFNTGTSTPTVGFSINPDGHTISSAVKDLGGGLYRLCVSITNNLGSPIDVNCPPHVVNGDSTPYSPAQYVGGLNFEKGLTPSSYIPTSGAEATRAAELVDIPKQDWLKVDIEGTVFIHFSSKEAQGYGMELRGPTLGDRIVIRRSGSGGYQANVIKNGNNNFAVVNCGADESPAKCAISWTETDAVAAAKGQSVSFSHAGIPNNLETLFLGRSTGAAGFPSNGHIIKVQYFPYAMTAQELEDLTS